MPQRKETTIAARVTPKERKLMDRAAKKQDRTLSEWMRLTLTIEAEIQLGVEADARYPLLGRWPKQP